MPLYSSFKEYHKYTNHTLDRDIKYLTVFIYT